MARLETHLIGLLNVLGDCLALGGAFAFGCWVRWNVDLYHSPLSRKFSPAALAAFFIVFFAANLSMMRLRGIYPLRRLLSWQKRLGAYSDSALWGLGLCMVLSYLNPSQASSRLLLLSASLAVVPLLVAKDFALRGLLHRLRLNDHDLRHVVMAGDDAAQLHAIAAELEGDVLLGLKVLGAFSPREDLNGLHRLGGLDDLVHYVENHVVDTAIFLGYEKDPRRIDAAMWECESRGIEVMVQTELVHRRISTVTMEEVAGVPMLGWRGGPANSLGLLIKYALDRVAAAVLLVLAAPVFLAVAAAVKAGSPGPVLFKQKRVGVNGRLFTFYKFRSMVSDAEERRASMEHLNEMTGPVFKVLRDPRVTPVGQWLRKTSLDELPQLWNVLKGEMSLVGPRPMLPKEVAAVHGWRRRKFSMKPGITCIWQVEGRNNVMDFDDRARMDLDYIDHWSLWLDLKLLLKTIPAVLFGSGA